MDAVYIDYFLADWSDEVSVERALIDWLFLLLFKILQLPNIWKMNDF